MPAGSGEKAQQQQQQAMGSGSGYTNPSSLYPNKSIWNPSFATPRDRPIGSKDVDENPTGSSALNPNSEADVWGPITWNQENPTRSVTNSPGRSRDAGIPNASAYYDHHHPHQHAAIGMKKNGYAVGNFQDESDAYASSFVTGKRNAHEAAAYLESIGAYAAPRDTSLPPSRHSQGSPAFTELYHHGNGHTPSNSIHSQRQMPGHSVSFSTQTTNQRAFNLNKQLEEEVALRFARQLSIDSASTNGQSFNPASQPFQPWAGDNGVSRFGGGLDFNVDLAQLAAMKRHSIDRISPSPNGYRLESGNSPRSYAQTPEAWATRPSSRDPRTVEYERRASAQFAPNYAPQYYPGQYPYGNIASPYPTAFPDPYNQTFRPPMIPGYPIAPLHPSYHMSPVLSPIRPSRDQDPGKGMRSVLLDEFRTSNKSSKRYELRDIYTYVVEFSGDQHGSRFIQQKLESANSDEKDQIFREIEPNAVQLMKDVFGNYVVQKFFEHGNQLQKKLLADKMKGKVVDLSVQVYACRVVQKALEHVLVEQQAELTKELEPDILKVIKDQNGNHVVQKIIELVPRQYIDFIMNAIRGQVTALASHTYGCRVIQRMLEYGNEADKLEIMGELHSSAQILITDQYGNYVAQHVIQNGKPEDRQKIIQLVLDQLLTFSKHKFASNVVEKCIEFGSTEQRTFIREQLSTAGSDGNNPLQQMMRDQYGNYVLQKLLSALQGSELDALVDEIKPHFYSLKKSGASRQLQALEKFIGNGKGEQSSAQSDTNSMATETPVLTNETNSPQSTSPPSTHASAVSIRADEGAKKSPGNAAGGVSLRVQEEEA
ncbi:Pumilio-like protein [Cladobotryum mycophilum]|uniref:Pumilio-like protein n=1 Tax=Cladobotryum mycophilum TaxID=491253 RepID=A0ABR0SCV4_9HYPO